MTTKYKVWIEIEHINEDEGVYEDVGDKLSAGEYSTFDEAESIQKILVDSVRN